MTINQQIAFCKKHLAKGGTDFNIFKAILDSLVKYSESIGGSGKDSLYHQCISAYDEFLKREIKVGVKMDGASGKAMKSIIQYLYKESKDQTDTGVLASWKFILANWNRQNEFIGKQKTLPQINKNLIEILDNIRNGNTKATEHNNRAAKQQLKNAIKGRQ